MESLEKVDQALANASDLALDDVALLWVYRAQITGDDIDPEYLAERLSCSEDEALDVFARLSEQGMIERG